MAKLGRKSGGSGVKWASVRWEDVRLAALDAFRRSAIEHHHVHNTWLVLEAVVRLAWWHATTHPGGAAYAVPSEAWLAARVGVCRETVSHAICRLEVHGLLHVTRRRPVDGKWQTNLYRIAGSVAGHLVRAARAALQAARDLSPSPVGGALKVKSVSHAKDGGCGLPLFATWMGRGGGGTAPVVAG